MDSIFWDIVSSLEFRQQLVAKWLIFTYIGTAFLVTYRAGFVNLGISAQLIGSSLMACYVAVWTNNLYISFFSAIFISIIIGIIPVLLKHFYKTNEILTTLFFSFIAIPIGQIIMRPQGNKIITATPKIPDNVVDGIVLYGSYLSTYHLMAIPFTVFAYLYLKYSIYGYKSKLIRSNAKILNDKEQLSVMLLSTIIASVGLVLAVFSDIISVKKIYISGEFDALGFIGVAVALVAFEKISLITVAALIIAGIEMLFLLLKISFGIPQSGALVFYGIGLLIAAFVLRKQKVTYDY